MWVQRMKTMFATKTAKHLGVGITLETIALRVMCNKRRSAERQWNSRQRGPLNDLESENGPDLQGFMKITIFQNFDSMTPTPCSIQSSAVQIHFSI